ncbi:MAG TPA: VOC family protein [Symbiobacteriaceae bacterium]|jgi:catechol 2,3-dioxygenase-like lactoylglutathione lyase family enzyme|nr:VOC family protein [Symbiobacteriaceae bacterium]
MRMRFASIFVSDEDQAIDFYVNKLGFELLMDNPTPFGGRFLAFMPPGGGTWLVASRPVPGIQAQVGTRTNIAWETEDIDGTYERLKAKGIQFPDPPKRQPWGGAQATFADPDGNVFMLHEIQK